MKLAAAVMMAVVLGGSAQGKSDFGRQITVYFVDHASIPETVRGPAQACASEIFARIGVKIHWKQGNPPSPESGALAIEFVTNTPETFKPGAMGYSMPYEGVHIVVFWDRIEADPARQKVLGHVVAHEITHILQGVGQHADQGIMKARWTGRDHSAIGARTLRFTEGDVKLIYNGMDARDASR